MTLKTRGKENRPDRNEAIREALKMWLRISKNKAAQEAIREYIRRRQSRFAEPRIQSYRTPHIRAEACPPFAKRRIGGDIAKQRTC